MSSPTRMPYKNPEAFRQMDFLYRPHHMCQRVSRSTTNQLYRTASADKSNIWSTTTTGDDMAGEQWQPKTNQTAYIAKQ